MAISKFIIPAGGLVVTGSTILSGTVVVTDNVSLTQLTASDHVSASNGYFANLNVNQLTAPSLNLGGDLTVSGNVNLGDGVGANVVKILDPVTASSGVEVSGGDLKVLAGALSASSTLQAGGQATLAGGLVVSGAPLDASAVAVSASALNVTNDISARSASLSGDLTVVGNLNVKGTATYIESTTVNIGDTNINLGTGSTDLAVLSGGGIDLGTGAQVQWRYNNTANAWTSNVGLSSSVSVLAPIGNFTVLTGSTTSGSLATFDTVSASVGLSGALGQFTQVTASNISASSLIAAPGVAALAFGTARAAVSLSVATPVGIDTFNPVTGLYSAVKYVISAKDATTGDVHAMEAMVTSDGTLAGTVIVPYASLYSNVPLFSLAATYSGGVIVTATRSVANTVNLKVLALTA